uniref:Uncharacterized protein n=1 Tax=Kalanchoe fedtschenkoi TaxID=63787 RepID=A0A7N0TN86_KALFE
MTYTKYVNWDIHLVPCPILDPISFVSPPIRVTKGHHLPSLDGSTNPRLLIYVKSEAHCNRRIQGTTTFEPNQIKSSFQDSLVFLVGFCL